MEVGGGGCGVSLFIVTSYSFYGAAFLFLLLLKPRRHHATLNNLRRAQHAAL